MDTTFMNSEKSKTSEPYGRKDKINLKKSGEYVASSNLRMYYKWENIKKSYKINKFKFLAPTCNRKFELTNGLYSISDIHD